MTMPARPRDIGSQINDVLRAHGEFIRSTHALFRFIEGEMTRRNWTLLRPAGYAVTSNGYARGLASCKPGEWHANFAGVAFLQEEAQMQSGVSVTNLDETPRKILVVQARWLEMSPVEEPVVWKVLLEVSRQATTDRYRKWEDWQTGVLTEMAREPELQPGGRFTLRPGKRTSGNVVLQYSGTGLEVAVADLTDPEAVVRRLIDAPVSGLGSPARM